MPALRQFGLARVIAYFLLVVMGVLLFMTWKRTFLSYVVEVPYEDIAHDLPPPTPLGDQCEFIRYLDPPVTRESRTECKIGSVRFCRAVGEPDQPFYDAI